MTATKQCPFCASMITARARFCPYCAEAQPAQQPVQRQPQQQPQQLANSYLTKCDACGSQIHVGVGHNQAICPYCGVMKVIPQQQPQQAHPQQAPQTMYAQQPQGNQSQSMNLQINIQNDAQLIAAQGYAVNKVIYILLCIFLGGIGIHKFYAGRTGTGILYLIFAWTFIPAILAFIDLIMAAMKPSDAQGNIIV